MEGVYFDPVARIATGHPTTTSDGADWDEMTISYQKRKRPVVVRCERRPHELTLEAEEVIDALRGSGSGRAQVALMARLKAARQLFVLEIDPAGASDACWEMVDNLQSWIAGQRTGVIYVPGEGCYEADLRPACKL